MLRPVGLDLDGVGPDRLRRAAEAAEQQSTLLAATLAAEEMLGWRVVDRAPYVPPGHETAEDLRPPAEIETPAELAAALRDAAEEVERVESDAAHAASLAAQAADAIEHADWSAAIDLLEQAKAIEDTYGDSPTYGPLLRAVQELAEDR